MEMKHSLHLQQQQTLIMTPRLQQALKLLQVPTLELQQILKQEVLQNPLLEEVDEVTEQEDIEKENSADEQANEEAEDPADEEPIDWTRVHAGRRARPHVRAPRARPASSSWRRCRSRARRSPRACSSSCTSWSCPRPTMRIAEFLVCSLDERGWVVTPMEEIVDSLGAPLEDVEKVLLVVQALEPAGVGARGLRECLLIQLEARGDRDTLPWRADPRPFRPPGEPPLPRDRARCSRSRPRRCRRPPTRSPRSIRARARRCRPRTPSTSFPTCSSSAWTRSTW